MGFSTYAKAQAGAKVGGGVPAGAASAGGAAAWHPDVLYLIALLAAEFVITGFLSHYLLKE